MMSKQIVLNNEGGLHARPATYFAEAAARFESAISIELDGRRADGKRVIGLMRLGAKRGDRIVLSAEGADEDEALAQLAALLERIDD